jgi:hypothetical protein
MKFIVISVLMLLCLAGNELDSSCSFEKAKSLALKDFIRTNKGKDYNLIIAKDSIQFYYFLIGLKRVDPYKENDLNVIEVGGARHYYYDKNTCHLIKIVKEQ